MRVGVARLFRSLCHSGGAGHDEPLLHVSERYAFTTPAPRCFRLYAHPSVFDCMRQLAALVYGERGVVVMVGIVVWPHRMLSFW
jgi:hypothetical protein